MENAGVYVSIILIIYVLGLVVLLLHHVKQKHGQVIIAKKIPRFSIRVQLRDLQVTLYDIYLELMPSRCTSLGNEEVGNRRSPDSDEEFERGSSFRSSFVRQSLRSTRRSLRGGEPGSASETQALNRQEKDGGGGALRGQTGAAAEEKTSVVQVHNSSDGGKDEAAAAVAVGEDAKEGEQPAYTETPL